MNVLSVLSHRKRQSGQTIPLTALFIVVLIGAGALVLDIARVYSLQRFERSVADAAALAGAQDLQTVGTRTVSNGNRVRARQDALDLLNRELGGTSAPTCGTGADIVDCAIPGTDYLVSIKTPSPSAMTVEPDLAVQVTVRQPAVSLTFARIPPFNQRNWNVGSTSVAGLNYGGQYAVVTLRPPRADRTAGDVNIDDLTVTGGSTLTIAQGDMGSNTSLVMDGCGGSTPSQVYLDGGFRIDHYSTSNPTWCVPVPKDRRINAPIKDPMYTVPVPPAGVPTYANADDGKDTATCDAAIATAIANGYDPTHWPSLAPKIPGGLTTTNTICYRPGVYNDQIANSSDTTVVLLEPGVYWFNKGLKIFGPLIGGYQKAAPGVSLVFKEGSEPGCNGGHCDFAGNNSQLIALNEGTCDAAAAVNCEDGAAPAANWDGSAWDGARIQVIFSGHGGTITVPETIIVNRDAPPCSVALLEPPDCYPNHDNDNKILSLPGGGSLYVAGVQYAPSDNVVVTGGSGGQGRIGQIIAWTLTYTGGSKVTEYFPGGPINGILRLDSACSGPNTTCTP